MKNTDIHRLLSRYYETWAGINAAYDRIAARCGVTSNVLYLLDTLYCAEAPMTQSEIGARLGLPKQTVASMVSTLERRGYVVREVAKDDHRRRHVLLTDEGRLCKAAQRNRLCLRAGRFRAYGAGRAARPRGNKRKIAESAEHSAGFSTGLTLLHTGTGAARLRSFLHDFSTQMKHKCNISPPCVIFVTLAPVSLCEGIQGGIILTGQLLK